MDEDMATLATTARGWVVEVRVGIPAGINALGDAFKISNESASLSSSLTLCSGLSALVISLNLWEWTGSVAAHGKFMNACKVVP
jgi:hypothetical protein